MRMPKLPSRMSPAEFRKFQEEWKGTFLAIHVDGGFAYGRVVRDTSLACYDLCSITVLPIEEIRKAAVFLVAPMTADFYLTAGWQVLGREPLDPLLDQPVGFFREDPITGEIDIYVEGRFVPYAGEDLSKMERLAAWTPPHLISRLEHHFFGKPDKYADRPPRLAKYRKT